MQYVANNTALKCCTKVAGWGWGASIALLYSGDLGEDCYRKSKLERGYETR